MIKYHNNQQNTKTLNERKNEMKNFFEINNKFFYNSYWKKNQQANSAAAASINDFVCSLCSSSSSEF